MSYIMTIEVFAGIAFFLFCLAKVLRQKPDPSRDLKLRLVEFIVLSFAAGTAIGLGVSSIYYAVIGQPFPGETLDSLRQAVAVGGLVLIVGPFLLLAERLK